MIAIAQHSVVGDYFADRARAKIGGVQLLWPATVQWYGGGVEMMGLTNIFIEWIFFLTSFAVMHKAKDTRVLFRKHTSNILFSIPIFTVLLPTLLSFPSSVPLELVIPHLVYLTIFSISIFIDLKSGPK